MESSGISQRPADSNSQQEYQKLGPRHLILAFLVMLCLLLGVNLAYRILASSEVGVVRYIITGDAMFLDEGVREKFLRDMDVRIEGYDAYIDERVEPWREEAMVDIQTSYQAAVNEYLDWYFSLTVSYIRLGHAVAGDLEPWLEDQLEQRLIDESDITSSFLELREGYAKKVAEAQREWLDETLAFLHQRYADFSKDEDELNTNNIPTVNLDQIVESARQDQFDVARWSVSQGAGGGGTFAVLAGPAIAKRLAAMPAMQAGTSLVRQFIARVGVQLGRSAVMGSTAAAAGAPTGPVALLIGASAVGASLAVAAGSEFALLKAQEALKRPDMEADLDLAWDDLQSSAAYLLDSDRDAIKESMLESLVLHEGRELQSSELPKVYRIFDRL